MQHLLFPTLVSVLLFLGDKKLVGCAVYNNHSQDKKLSLLLIGPFFFENQKLLIPNSCVLSLCSSYIGLIFHFLLHFLQEFPHNTMLYLFISFLSFILLSKSFSYKRLLPWEAKMSLFSAFLVSWFHKGRVALSFFHVLNVFDLPLKNNPCSTKLENLEEKKRTSLLDLPELALELILDRLSPSELCKMANVCTDLRDVCEDDYFWEKHMKQKWGKLMGNSACKEWSLHKALRRRSELSSPSQKKGLFSSYFGGWSFSLVRPKLENKGKIRSPLPIDSMKAWYQSLESGKLWFPAQVYNRESGHAGFMLSCYDAQISYDSQTDMFKARYPPHGRRIIEENIHWNRLRAPPVSIPPHVLHVTDCLANLKPGDHIEIQWRKSKEFSYGWWYGVVCHLEACDGIANNCSCCCNDMVMLEFSQYSVESRWRKTVINRKSHEEEGNEADGYYGGLRKLYKEEEITRWKRLWPNGVLE